MIDIAIKDVALHSISTLTSNIYETILGRFYTHVKRIYDHGIPSTYVKIWFNYSLLEV